MGYIRKHREDIRSGFELVFIMGGILGVCPLIMYLQMSSF